MGKGVGVSIRRAVPVLAAVLALILTVGAPAAVAGELLDRAGQALRTDPVFVDPNAERPITTTEADGLRLKIQRGGQPVFVAVLPAAAINEAGSPDNLPKALHDATGLAGTYAVLAGSSFRA